MVLLLSISYEAGLCRSNFFLCWSIITIIQNGFPESKSKNSYAFTQNIWNIILELFWRTPHLIQVSLILQDRFNFMLKILLLLL